jgi:hypothetical protein
MSKNIQIMAASVEQLNIRMATVSDTMKDHEVRIRDVEKNTFKKKD